jgi:hypothetical protein
MPLLENLRHGRGKREPSTTVGCTQKPAAAGFGYDRKYHVESDNPGRPTMNPPDQSVTRRRDTDSHGRVLPLTAEERRVRSENLRRTIERLRNEAGNPDDEGDWSEVYRSIDEGRPERPLFEGMY